MMQTHAPIEHDIVLVGGGHAHVEVLRQFAMHPVPTVRLTVISREIETPYSGMLPGYLAGHYTFEQCHIDLGPLCAAAGARLYRSQATGLDLVRRQVLCDHRPPVAFDHLSLDIGSTPNLARIEGHSNAIAIKPVADFLQRWRSREEALLKTQRAINVAVIGGGAGGVEVSLCLHHRLSRRIDVSRLRISILNDTPYLLENHAPAVRARLMRALRSKKIEMYCNQPVKRILPDAVHGEHGLRIESDVSVITTEASAPQWLGETGLALDKRGFVRVNERLQCESHPFVFAVGDIASFSPAVAKNGVYAVRQGPVLAETLLNILKARKPRVFVPQKRTLALISTGGKNAIVSYGPVTLEGRWVWSVKDWIDRRWMEKYQHLSMGPMQATEDVMRCGGCGAKVPAEVLSQVLSQFEQTDRDDILVGLGAPDDAAVTQPPDGMVTVQTVDQFRSFVDDPYLFGRIAANHALSDIYAMGANPSTALAIVTLPYATAQKMGEDLRQLLTGARQTLEEGAVALVGGHTGEGAELSFGLSVTGYAKAESLFHKTGLCEGDVIIMTKPLGTGTLLAGMMQSKVKRVWLDAAFGYMTRSNRDAARIFRAQKVNACTDVTGFGLVGHLGEMVKASGVHVTLRMKSVPVMSGARELLAAGVSSTLHPGNLLSARRLVSDPAVLHGADILLDPQTSGGLIAGVGAPYAEETLSRLHAAGDREAAVIGHVTTGPAGLITLD